MLVQAYVINSIYPVSAHAHSFSNHDIRVVLRHILRLVLFVVIN